MKRDRDRLSSVRRTDPGIVGGNRPVKDAPANGLPVLSLDTIADFAKARWSGCSGQCIFHFLKFEVSLLRDYLMTPAGSILDAPVI